MNRQALHRQELLRKARKGDEKARQELQETYNVRVWSEKERATLVYEIPDAAKRGKRKVRKS